MSPADPAVYHKLYGIRKPRATYYAKDFLDYVLMLALTGLVTGALYGFGHPMSLLADGLCAMALVMFAVRHGVELRVPLILRRPQDVLYTFAYKLQNMRTLYFVSIGVLLLENLAIAATPGLPHHVAWMRTLALALFYLHFIGFSLYRTIILADHLRKKELVREVLMQTPWKRVITERTKIAVEIVHAYGTGLLTHIVLIGPWYFLMTHVRFSLVFLLPVAVINIKLYDRWMGSTYNSWFYRDHWVGHNAELEFVYLHGTHHDAIPSAMIAVSGNGFLEGILRHSLGVPAPFFNPIGASLVYAFEVKSDMDLHQYIPGVFPQFQRLALEASQHSTHHYGRLEPYGVGVNGDAPGMSEGVRKRIRGVASGIRNSIRLDEELTGFEWDNAIYRQTLSLYAKYQPDEASAAAPAVDASAQSVS
ncbi:MAG TPA: hypothetical protein VNN08_03735 [Thermoanaerobaculia bacterium]|nr:hypothetical protein [Thermoanaerobaculia bacterium]